jgi:hypothetical protein
MHRVWLITPEPALEFTPFSRYTRGRPAILLPQLSDLSAAYRLPDGMGGFGTFQYRFVPGVAFLPRDGNVPWQYSGYGCISVPYGVYLPLVLRGG